MTKVPETLATRLLACPFWARIAAFALAYLAVALLGDWVGGGHAGFNYFWLPGGLLLSFLLLEENHRWPVLLVVVSGSDLLYNLIHHQPILIALGLVAGNALEVVVAARIVRRWVAQRPAFASLKEVAGFVSAAAVSCLLGASVGAGLAALWLAEGFWPDWWLRAGGHLLAAVLVAPLLLAKAPIAPRSSGRGRLEKAWEGAALTVVLATFSWTILVANGGEFSSYKYLLAPLLMWAGMRFGLRAGAFATIVVAITAVAAAGPELSGLTLILLVTGTLTWLVPVTLLAEGKKAERELRASQALLNGVLHGTCDAVYVKDTAGRYLLFNAAAESISGKPAAEVLGKGDEYLFPAEVAQSLREIDRTAMASDGPRTFEEVITVRSGQLGTFLSTKGPLWDAAGNVIGLFGVAHDITERKRSETALQESEERYRLLFEHMEEGLAYCQMIFENDEPADFVYLLVNDKFATLTGLKDVIGKRVSAVIPGIRESDPELLRLYGRVAGTGKPSRVEMYVRALNGWFSLSVFSPRLGFFVVVFDVISARKRVEEALRKSEEKFFKLFHSNPTAIMIVDIATNHIFDVNEAFELIVGYRRDELVGCGWRELRFWVDPVDQEATVQQFETEGRVRNRECQFRRKDGTVFPGLMSAELIEVDGRPCLLSATVDITEQRNLENQLLQAQKLESVGRLAGGVAHDFNNLLTVINGYGDLILAQLKEGEPLRDLVAEVRKAGERAKDLTQQLLAFSRKQISEPKLVDLNALITENLNMLQLLVGEDIEVEAQLDPSLNSIVADPGQIHQVLMNLAVNSRDAMPRGGRLTLCTANVEIDESMVAPTLDVAPGSFVLFSVSDTGCGISEEHRQHIFEPFFTTKGKAEGTGLGLSTVYGIVRQSGGAISLESEPNHGATFKIYFPRTHGQPDQDVAAAAAEEPRGSETVLVVEDQEAVRKFTVTVLKERGYGVLEAASGAEALTLAQRHTGEIQLLLTDVIMPGMNGKELADSLRPLHPETKVLYMSGYTADVVSQRGLLDPGVLLIAKPFSADALSAKVRETLGAAWSTAEVLVVDDEAPVRQFFQQILAAAGYQVMVASSGSEALRIAKAHKFQLIVTDLVMPDGEGIETIRALRSTQPDLRIIATSGAFGGAFLNAAAALGANFTLPKPVSQAQLLAAVRAQVQ